MTEIKLLHGHTLLIDDIDVPFIKGLGWHAHTDRFGKTYVVARRGAKRIKLHRYLLGAPDKVEVDHRDGNGLNNQRHNLRLSTHEQNCRNRGIGKYNKSGFKGVSYKKKNRCFCAQIKAGKVIHLGLFDNALLAALAYDEAADRLHGEFAVTNRKLGLLPSGC